MKPPREIVELICNDPLKLSPHAFGVCLYNKWRESNRWGDCLAGLLVRQCVPGKCNRYWSAVETVSPVEAGRIVRDAINDVVAHIHKAIIGSLWGLVDWVAGRRRKGKE